MLVVINGKETPLSGIKTLDQLIEFLELKDGRIAVEINQQIIPRSEFQDYQINEGDRLEIVHAIGGG